MGKVIKFILALIEAISLVALLVSLVLALCDPTYETENTATYNIVITVSFITWIISTYIRINKY